MKDLYLKDILPAELPPLVSLENLTPIGDATVEKDGSVTVKKEGGLRTDSFVAGEETSAIFFIRSEKPMIAKIAFTDSHGNVHYDGIQPYTSIDMGNGIQRIWKNFDAGNLAVYHDAVSFFVEILCKEENTFRLESGVIRGKSPLERLSVYGNNLEEIVRNTDKRIATAEYQGANNTETILESPSGKKFLLNVDDNGNLSTTPVIPNKVLFMGNSLLLGMGFYGMCATTPEKDYFHLVSEAILAKNPHAEINRVHGAVFEQLENPDNFDSLWYEKPNCFTLKPTCESFTPDLDLIVIQLIENTNNPTKLACFQQIIDKFILHIKKHSPKARIVWVRSWWLQEERDFVLEAACRRHRIGCLSIGDLNRKETLGIVGQTYVKADGSVVPAPEYWLGHPGDEGMRLIAERIIDYLKL